MVPFMPQGNSNNIVLNITIVPVLNTLPTHFALSGSSTYLNLNDEKKNPLFLFNKCLENNIYFYEIIIRQRIKVVMNTFYLNEKKKESKSERGRASVGRCIKLGLPGREILVEIFSKFWMSVCPTKKKQTNINYCG